jgi:hypothetical protein
MLDLVQWNDGFNNTFTSEEPKIVRNKAVLLLRKETRLSRSQPLDSQQSSSFHLQMTRSVPVPASCGSLSSEPDSAAVGSVVQHRGASIKGARQTALERIGTEDIVPHAGSMFVSILISVQEAERARSEYDSC